MSYLKAVLRKDSQEKINQLEKIIVLGKKLKKNTTPDEKKLEILLKRENKTTKPSIKKVSTNSIYSITSVYTKNDSIIVNFNHKISKNDIKFFELHQGNIYKDVFDISGSFKDARPTVLKINNIKKITIGQFKAKTLRIVLANEKNLKTYYTIKDKQLIINIQDLNTTKTSKTTKIRKEVKKSCKT